MVWTVEYDPRVEKDLKAIDRAVQREILDYLDTRIATDEDARRFGKPLRHELRGLWRYRVRDYRILKRGRTKMTWGVSESAHCEPQPAAQGEGRHAGNQAEPDHPIG